MAKEDDLLEGLGLKDDRPPLGARPSSARAKAQAKRDEAKAAPKSKPAAAPRRATKDTQLKDGIASVYTTAGMGLVFAGEVEAGEVILAHAEKASEAWLELSQRDVRVRRILERLTTGSAWGDVIMVHVSMVLPILASRGFIPGMPGNANPNPDPSGPIVTPPVSSVPPHPGFPGGMFDPSAAPTPNTSDPGFSA